MKTKSYALLAGLLGLTIAATACGAASGTNGTSGSAASAEQSGAAQGSSSAADGGYKVATVRWADWGENYHTGFPDQAAADAGITVTWDTILNSDWGDKKAVLLAGGNLPDAFMGSICFSETDILTNTGSFIALDDYIDEYMPNFKKIMEEDPTMKALAYSADGHIYGLPSKKPCRPTVAKEAYPNVSYTPDQLSTLATLFTDLDAYVSSNQATWVTEGGVDE